jgi:hypothetical protein
MGESIEIEIFDDTISISIRSVAVENSDVIRIPNLMKKREYSIRVNKTDATRGRHMVNSNLNTISTTKGSEFRVSNKFYKAISRWSSIEMQSKKLISYLKENSDNVNLY